MVLVLSVEEERGCLRLHYIPLTCWYVPTCPHGISAKKTKISIILVAFYVQI
jgi:hypothetical protein